MNSPKATSRSLWRNRDFMLLWSGQLVSSTGSGMSGLVFPLLILAITRSPVRAGLGGFLFSMPYLILSLPAGALVDRWDRKRVTIVCDAVRAVNAASIPLAAWLWQLHVGQLYLYALVEGTGFVFFNIAEVACLPRVVDRDQLPEATGQNQGGTIATGIISPPLGGFLFQSIGRTIPFLADAISYGVSVLSLSPIQVRFQEERTAVRRRLRMEIVEGVS